MPGDNTFQHFSTSTSNGLSRHRQQAPQPTVQSQFEQLQRHHQEHNEQLLQLTRDNSDPDARFRSMAYTPLPLEYEQQQQQRSPPPASYSTPSSPHGSLVALLREQQLQAAESNSLRLGERREDNTEETQSNASEEGSRSRSRRNSSSSESSVSQTRHPSTASVSSRKATSASPRPSVKARQQVTKAAKAIAASTNSTARKAATSGEATATGPAVSGEKRSRYLREIDRRSIIHRIDRGEKQAALAKEFGVTRAAICHINKNRVEILTRSTRADVHSGARHPKRGMYTTSASAAFSSPGPTAGLTATAAPADNQPSASVFEVRSLAMGLILTTLRRRETEAREFQNSAERAVRLLLEEALARVPTRSVDVTTPIDYVCE
ncbi:Uracil phosphoribosyltransferase, partial [Globisporangium polare]